MKRTVLFSILAAAAVALSTPAAAHHYVGHGGYGPPYPFETRQVELQQRVERMAYSGRISRHEYRQFQDRFAHFNRLQLSYRRGGIELWEARALDAQLDRIEAQIREERRENYRDHHRDHW